MTPQEQGRFCDKCQKCVVDLSAFTDEELYKYFTAHKGQNVCGRLRGTQLNRTINLPPQPHSTLYKWIIAAGLAVAFAVSPGTNAFAQVPYTNEHTLIDREDEQQPATDSTSFIKGIVTDENNEPIINAIVTAAQDGKIKGGAVTDFDGKFVLKPLAGGSYTLEVNYIGYEKSIIRQTPTGNYMNRIKMIPADEIFLDGAVMIDYTYPLIDRTEGGSSKTMSSEDLTNMGH